MCTVGAQRKRVVCGVKCARSHGRTVNLAASTCHVHLRHRHPRPRERSHWRMLCPQMAVRGASQSCSPERPPPSFTCGVWRVACGVWPQWPGVNLNLGDGDGPSQLTQHQRQILILIHRSMDNTRVVVATARQVTVRWATALLDSWRAMVWQWCVL